MTIFDEISDTYKKIQEVKDKIVLLRLQSSSPKTSVINDMPRDFCGPDNPLERYMLNQEKLEDKQKRLLARYEKLWKVATRQMKAANIDEQTQKMMYYRFGLNLKWKKCAATLEKKYPDGKWNVNKCFRKYREVLCRVGKQKIGNC